jgi:hypothetical protein
MKYGEAHMKKACIYNVSEACWSTFYLGEDEAAWLKARQVANLLGIECVSGTLDLDDPNYNDAIAVIDSDEEHPDMDVIPTELVELIGGTPTIRYSDENDFPDEMRCRFQPHIGGPPTKFEVGQRLHLMRFYESGYGCWMLLNDEMTYAENWFF